MSLLSGIFSRAVNGRGVKGTFKLTSIDRGLGRIKNALRSIQVSKSHVKAGLTGKANKPRSRAKKGAVKDALTSVQLGLWHEFGTSKVPARPFIRPAFTKHRAEYMELLKVLVQASVYSGRMSYDKALGIIGAKMAADMKKFVTTGPQIPPPNSPEVMQRKANAGYHKLSERAARARQGKEIPEGPLPSPRTLVDTGRMINAITWGVILNGQEAEAGK